MDIFCRETIQDVDNQVITQGMPEKDLINEVANSLFSWCFKNINTNDKVLFLVGPGNNGSDALFLAQIMSSRGFEVDCLQAKAPRNAPDSLQPALVTFDDCQTKEYTYIFDGLFGTGLNQEIRAPYADWLKWANQRPAKRVAIDIPSGINANTGEVDPQHFTADITLTIAVGKPGLFLLPGTKSCGAIHVVEVPTLKNIFDQRQPELKTLGGLNTRRLKPHRTDHKYSHGVVTVVLSELFPGAALMAAHAAQKAGAGYTQLLCPQKLLLTCQVQHPDLVFKPFQSLTDLLDQLNDIKSGSVVIGPGWPKENSFLDLQYDPETIYIFDGGYLTPQLLSHLKSVNHDKIIITPHEGELSFLLNNKDNKWNLCASLLKQYSGIIIAKGYDSLILQKDQTGFITEWNSPTLATAGSGDILCGLLAAVALKEKDPLKTSALAVNIHRHLPQGLDVSISPATLMDNIEAVLQKFSF